MLTGSFTRNLDEKLRLAIPKELRDPLALAQGAVLYIAPGTDGSLSLYTEEEFSKLALRLHSNSPTGSDVRAFSRMFFSQARRAEIDAQGRVRIPAELTQSAGIEKDVMMLGVWDHIELWDRQRWEEYLANKSADYDAIAESAFEK